MTDVLPASAALVVGDGAGGDPTLACECEVVRIGEIFVELGWRPLGEAEPAYSKWSLVVKDNNLEVMYSATVKNVGDERRSKVAKLKAGKSYFFTVRLYDEATNKWGPPATGRFRMLSEVATKCTAIGEDNAVFRWDRPQLPVEPNHCLETSPELSASVRQIQGYTLKVLAQGSNQVEFHQEFEPGTRTYTIYGLKPGCRYVVLACWHTLLGHACQWQECLLFETQSAYQINVNDVGEDFISIAWQRAPCPSDEDPDSAYQRSTSHQLQFEIVIEGGGHNELTNSIELQSSETSHTLQGLLPSTSYSLKLRAMSTRGRWGVFSECVRLRTLSMLAVTPVRHGENFVKLLVQRRTKQDDEKDEEYRVNVLGVSHKFNYDESRKIAQVRADEFQWLVDELSPGRTYKVYAAAVRSGNTGLWSEGLEVTTRPRPVLMLAGRGEDFITLKWERQVAVTLQEQGVQAVPMGRRGSRSSVIAHRGGDGTKYQLQVELTGGTQEVIYDEVLDDAECDGFRIPNLTPETQYRCRIRTVQTQVHQAAKHGMWSEPVVMTTLRPVSLQLVDIGEDFLQLQWRRALHTASDVAAMDQDDPRSQPSEGTWFDLKYEVVLGCVDSGEDEILHKELVETEYRISQLAPNTTYSVAVRACNEKEQWGLWCTVYFRTLSSVVLRCHEVGEDFARVVWERDAVGPASSRLAEVFSADSFVSRYRLLIYCVDEIDGAHTEHVVQTGAPCLDAVGANNTTTDPNDEYPPAKGSAFVFDKLLDPTHTSYRVPEILADRKYAAVVRAASKTGIWGLWSDPVRFSTVAPFVIPVNDLSIGENYVHFLWGRDENPMLEDGVQKGDYNVTSQMLRIRGLDHNYALDRTLPPNARDLKVYGLKPATAYSIQIRSCNTSGEWGTWSRDVKFQTRATIVMRTVEIAENYIVVRWERKRSDDRDRGYPSGRGYITRYHLRVTGEATTKDGKEEEGYSFDAELTESSSPYRITGLNPNTRYRVVIKANYNDDEWGLWSRPLECLTLKLIDVKTMLIGEEFANIKWTRPEQSRQLVIAEKSTDEEPIMCFGQARPHYQLRVTTKDTGGAVSHGQLSWDGMGAAITGLYKEDSEDSEEAGERREKIEMKIVMEVELHDVTPEVPYTVSNLKPDTHYSIAVRSKIEDGTWGVWSTVQRLVTLKPCVISFVVIGEDFARIEWERPVQQVLDGKIAKGRGIITKSQIKVKTPTGQVQTYDIQNAQTNLTIEDYRPATTYNVSVRTFNDNHDWGLWSPDKAFRTVAGLVIDVESVGEDYLWMSFAREQSSTQDEPGVNTVVSVDTSVFKYQVRCTGDNGFNYIREIPGDVRRCLALQGLRPSGTYEMAVRGLSRHEVWGQWAGIHFQTLNRMRVSFGNIGEQFAVVQWARPDCEANLANMNCLKPDQEVTKYRLRIAEVGNVESTRLFDLPNTLAAFKVPELAPNSEYSVWVSACNSKGVWGLWSVEQRVHTLPALSLTIKDIGEAYALVSWQRDDEAITDLALPTDDDGETARKMGTSHVQEYHVKVEGRQGVVVERRLEPGVTECKVEGLEVDTIYRVSVRMKDSKDEWGLWSTMRRFVTLRPVELAVQKVGESFVHLQWGRQQERRKDKEDVYFEKHYDDEEDEEEEEEVPEEDEEDEEEEEHDKQSVSPKHALAEDMTDVAIGSDEVKRWIVRVVGNGNTSEFELEQDDLQKRITDLEPAMTYTISVRALSASNEWGFWSEAQTITTLPLITTDISYVGEDFIIVAWNRPKSDNPPPNSLVIFPPENGVHTYQLKITPLADTPEEADPAKLASGERDFDVSQPKYEVWDLWPGTRYEVGVREKDIEGNWGRWSVIRTVQTLDPIGLKLVDLGECFCSCQWERVPKPNRPELEDVYLSNAESTLYQVAVDTLHLKDTPTIQPSSGQSNQLRREQAEVHLIRTFKKGETEWTITDLHPNKTYVVKVRCQTDGEYWGGWSAPLEFATMKLLTIQVDYINEDNVLLSWARDPVDWLMDVMSETDSRRSPLEGSDAGGDTEVFSQAESPTLSSAVTPRKKSANESSNDATAPAASSALANIRTGNYTVTEYELKVEGLGHTVEVVSKLPAHLLTHRASGLLPDRLYSATIRSKNTLGVWSMWACKVSFLTLNQIQMKATKLTENFIWLKWGRDKQDTEACVTVLDGIMQQMEEEAKLATKHRQAEQKKRLEEQNLDDSQKEEQDEDETAPDDGVPAAHDDVFVPEPHLQISNLATASRECTAYHVKVWGDSGFPLMPSEAMMIPSDDPFKQAALERKRKREQKAVARSARKERGEKLRGDRAGMSSAGRSKRGKRNKGVAKSGAETKSDDKDDAPSEEDVEEVVEDRQEDIDEDHERCLLDVQMRKGVVVFKVDCLTADTLYQFAVRARNSDGEWGLWSNKLGEHTMPSLELCNTRFGEHYINLYWYRPSQRDLRHEAEQEQLRRAFEEAREKERVEREAAEKAGLPAKTETPATKEKARKEMRQHKARVRELRDLLERRKEGKGEIYTPEGTQVDQFVLRIVSEDGAVEDRTLDTLDDDGNPTLNLYTIANLIPNHLYVVQLIMCYGGEWGEWSAPIKFMTQNLLQLSISYVGESFIQLDWKRAPNKRLKGEDMSQILMTPTEQGLGHHYQIDVVYETENKNTGFMEERKQSVDVVDTNSFRITGLVSDMKYTLAVREWDPKGDWGLWSPQRSCMTLSRMVATVHDIGENWIEVSWERMQPRIKYDDPSIVSIPVSVTAYYLSIEELDDNDLPEDEDRRRYREEERVRREAEESAKQQESEAASLERNDGAAKTTDSEDESGTDEEEDQMAAHRRRQRKKEEEDRQRLAELEAAVLESEKGVIGPDGRYRMTRKLDPTISVLTVNNLKPNRFCNVRVQAETSGNELGVWSPDCFLITKDRIHVDVELVGEDSFTVSWCRPPNRRHPRLHDVNEGDTSVDEFEAEVQGLGEAKSYHAKRSFTPGECNWKVTGLAMDSVYGFRVRSRDATQRWSLYSSPMEIVTLRQIRVYPIKTTEQLMVVQWGRDPQKPEDYPQRTDDVNFVISHDRTLQYHLKVYANDERKSILVDKTFIGSLNRYIVNYLSPNMTYHIEARACNAAGEWGAWSKQIEVFTMKLLSCAIEAVGESYVKIHWWRSYPDTWTEKVGPVQSPPPVFTSPETQIDKYQVNVALLGSEQEWEWTTEVPNPDGMAHSYTIANLLPDKRYQVYVKASYKDGDWGTPSPTVATATLNVITVQTLQAGEDYIKARWHRMEHTYEPALGDPELQVGTLEKTLRWQYRITNLTEVDPFSDSVAGGEIVAEDFTTDLSRVFTELEPNQRYRIEVRHWFLPIVEAQKRKALIDAHKALLASRKTSRASLQGGGGTVEELPDDVPAGSVNDESAAMGGSRRGTVMSNQTHETSGTAGPFGASRRRSSAAASLWQHAGARVPTPEPEVLPEGMVPDSEIEGEPGVWGLPTHVATSKPMVAIIDEIAEDFFTLRWERDPNARKFPPSSVAELSPDIQGYHVMIDQLDEGGKQEAEGDDTLHIDHEFGPDETAFRVSSLVPATAYRVLVRACTDGQWGLWSKPCVLITLPKLSITVNSIGEDYVVLSWERLQKQLEHMQALVGSSANVSRYQLEMYGVDSPFHTDKKFKATRTSYKVKHLDVNSMYTVRVRSCDSNNAWSLWSDYACFVTLKPITVSFGKVAEQFVHLKWHREEQKAEEYARDPPPQLPDASVTKFHLCVFASEHAPSAALVDKQFSGNVTEYKVTNLNPNSMYIVIVRAANSELQWGSWSEERTALTLPLLNVRIESIGENYLTFGWGREETNHPELQSGVVVASTEWHVVVTSHELQYEKQIGVEDLIQSDGKFTIRSLKPDNKYILTLRACYGNDEWGLWTNPVTFLTLNQLGLTVSNINEDKADFTWGRGVQSALHTYDPNLVIWKGLILKYALQIRKLVNQDGMYVVDPERPEPDFFLEREMDLNKFKYIQTYCTTDELTVNTEYLVKVRAMDDHQEWGEWTELVFETPPLPPGKPILKKAHSNYIAFDWEPPDVHNRYLYCVEQAISKTDKKKDDRMPGDPGLEWKVVDTVGETYVKIKTTAALTKCRFRVKCCKIDKPVHLWSKYSPVAAFMTAVPPEAVTNLTITSLSKNSATLEWVRGEKPPPAADGSLTPAQHAKVTYKILLGEKDGPVQFVGTTRACHYELTGLKANMHYRTQVHVETDSGVSVKNTILKFSTRADTAEVSRFRKDSDAEARVPKKPAPPKYGAPHAAGKHGGAHAVSSESSDTLGNKLPLLSPPRTAPTHHDDHIIARVPVKPASSPMVPRGGVAAPHGRAMTPQKPATPLTGTGGRPGRRQETPPTGSEYFDGTGLEPLPDLGHTNTSSMFGAPIVPHDQQSHHSDEQYDVLSLQHSDDSQEQY